MKKLLPLLFCLFLFKANSQTLPEFPKDSAQWTHRYYGYTTISEMDFDDYFDTTYFYTMKGDTTITSTGYKKLSFFKGWYDMGVFDHSPEQQVGALRYDSIANRVYYYKYSAGMEELAYKFDLSAGNNFATNYTPDTTPDSTITYVVDSTIQFNPFGGLPSVTRNVRYLRHPECGWSGFMPAAIINNIGSIFGLFSINCPTEINIRELMCFSDLGLGDPVCFNSHSILTGVHSSQEENVLEVFPNPATEQFTVSFKRPLKAEIILLNSLGQVVHTNIIKDTKTTIDIRSLSTGIYFLRVNAENHTFVKKIIKE